MTLALLDRDSPAIQAELFAEEPAPSTRTELHSLGGEILLTWSRTGSNPRRALLTRQTVLLWSAALPDPTLEEALALVASHLEALGFTELSQAKLKRDIGQFISMLSIRGVATLRAVAPAHANEFIRGAVRSRPTSNDWRTPSPSIVGARRSAVRTLFMTARHLGLADGDPTLDISVPSRGDYRKRPLTDDEHLLGRLASRMSLFDLRNPAIWAIGEASAMPIEIARVRTADVHLDEHFVALSGTKDRRPRCGPLTEWGCQQLAARLQEIGNEPDRPVVYEGQGGVERLHASIGMKVIDILNIAGIRQPEITAASLASWRARQVFEETGRIEHAASMLGVASLDRAARLIGWRWADEPTDI